MNNRVRRRDLLDIRSGKELLVALLLGGGVFAIMGTAPWLLAGTIPLALAFKDSRKNRRKASYSFWYAKKRKYLSVRQHHGKMQIALTERGRRIAEEHLLRMRAAKATSTKWDRKWRLILFDVPMEDHQKRNALRYLLRRLGAIKLQQSVWIYTHDCSEEISFFQEFFGLGSAHIRVVVTEDIGDDRVFRKHFNLPPV